MSGDVSDIDTDSGIEGIEEARDSIRELSQSPADVVSQKMREDIEELEHVTLNIAVTGNTGAGKSTFVNAIRGLCDDDEGAAETGVTETTRVPHSYPHPTMSNVTIWDLPGIGTPNFRAKSYLSDVNFDRYDFFIILTSERFKENDIKLAKAIKKKKKLFYFIRSKIDNDINAESRKRDFSQASMLSKIREDCRKNLRSVGNPEVFLISSHNLDLYDFSKLMDNLEKDLPAKKKHALIQSLPVYSAEALQRKKKHFQKLIWLTAFGSGAVAVVPVPGLTVVCDYGIVISFLGSIFRSFGLEDVSLKILAGRVSMNWKDLKTELKSAFKDGVTVEAVGTYFTTPSMASIMTLKGLMSGAIPFAQLPAGMVSVAVMHYLLNKGLKELENDTKAVLEKARLL